MNESPLDDSLVGRYEMAFAVFMAAIAFLLRGAGGSADTTLLALFAALMGLNFAAARALRAQGAAAWLAAAIALANCFVAAFIVERSGGSDSLFWVLYLMPIYASCLLMRGRQTALITMGALALDAVGCVPLDRVWSSGDAVGLAIKSAVLASAAAVISKLAARERAARERLERKRSEVRELEELARVQRLKLEESGGLSEAGLVSAGLAHDFQKTLAVVLAFTEVGLREENLTPRAREDFAGIRRSATLAQEIVTAFLGSSRRAALTPEPLSVNDTLRDTVDILKGSMTGCQDRLCFEPDAGLPLVVGSRTQLQRLFLNLMTNALKAVREADGSVVVSTCSQEAHGHRQVVVTVEDDGPGLPDQVLANMFQPFTPGVSPGGNGLGLYICWELARDNGGRLHGENKPEGGARFTVFLPAPRTRPPLALNRHPVAGSEQRAQNR